MGRVVCLEEAQDWRAEVQVDEVPEEQVQEEAHAMEGIDEEVPGDGEEKKDKGKTVLQPLKGPFVCTVDEINEAFNWVKSVRYSQPIVLSGKPFTSPDTTG
jgi:cleavage and polyadenylation specificity factor subunit 2